MMDDATCLNNITACLNSIGLQLCDVEKDMCRQRGWCVTSIIPSNVSACVCNPCYHGDYCEKETFSKNLWYLGQPSLTPEMMIAYKLFLLFFSIIKILNCIFCLQTYFFSKKIRRTNAGVYLIFNSIISILIGLEYLITSVLFQFAKQLPDRYFQMQCLIDQKFVLLSLAYMSSWCLFFLALERMLVEFDYFNMFDPLKRSLVVSTLIFIICPLATIPGIFTLKDLSGEKLNPQVNLLLIPLSCINYTPLGYTIFKVINGIYGYGPLISYIILSLIVFVHLTRHRKHVVPRSTTLQNIPIVLRKHKDFFVLLLVPIIFTMPFIILDASMTCSKAVNLKAFPYLMLVLNVIWGLIPMSFSFFYELYPARVYRLAFWNESPVGRFLRFSKRKIIQISGNLRNCCTYTRLHNNPQVQT